jgi:hypothetical protein
LLWKHFKRWRKVKKRSHNLCGSAFQHRFEWLQSGPIWFNLFSHSDLFCLFRFSRALFWTACAGGCPRTIGSTAAQTTGSCDTQHRWNSRFQP